MTFTPRQHPPQKKHRRFECTIPHLREACQIAAELVRMDEKYLALFLRVEQELRVLEAGISDIDRARQMAENSIQFSIQNGIPSGIHHK